MPPSNQKSWIRPTYTNKLQLMTTVVIRQLVELSLANVRKLNEQNVAGAYMTSSVQKSVLAWVKKLI